jgi:GNAT superfamily N-acetyltransferase
MQRPIKPEDRGWDRRKTMAIVSELSQRGALIIPSFDNVGAFVYELEFPFNVALVTVSISIAEWQTNSDVVITNMTTFPVADRRKGYGSRIIGIITKWARHNKFNEIRATQVSNSHNQRFWERNGFILLPAPNPIGDLVLELTKPLQ